MTRPCLMLLATGRDIAVLEIINLEEDVELPYLETDERAHVGGRAV